MAQPSKLNPWMHWLLKIAGGYNMVAGLSMILFYHEGFKSLGINKPDMNLPIQLVGMMVLLFGIGYLMVDRNPGANRNVLLLGLLSKFIGPLLAIGYVIRGELPTTMIPVLFFADVVYLVPFWMIYRAIGQSVDVEVLPFQQRQNSNPDQGRARSNPTEKRKAA